MAVSNAYQVNVQGYVYGEHGNLIIDSFTGDTFTVESLLAYDVAAARETVINRFRATNSDTLEHRIATHETRQRYLANLAEIAKAQEIYRTK